MFVVECLFRLMMNFLCFLRTVEGHGVRWSIINWSEVIHKMKTPHRGNSWLQIYLIDIRVKLLFG